MFYNFFALGDDEFEELSRDILSRELDQKMRIFGKGADQGIDIADCKDGRTIIAQCKNYINTPTSDLMSTLEKEKDKVEKLNPKEYYLFINKDISPKRINAIYELFQEWMPSNKNIYTRSDCDAFISKNENQDIAQKYPRLLNLNSLHNLNICSFQGHRLFPFKATVIAKEGQWRTGSRPLTPFGQDSSMDCPCRCLMLNSPVSIHTVLCTMRSRMASAMVSPPRRLCHSLVASWVANAVLALS